MKTPRPMRALLVAALLLPALSHDAAHAKKDGESWAEGIEIVTDYEKAIERAKETGRMLLIYNGWKRDGI